MGRGWESSLTVEGKKLVTRYGVEGLGGAPS